MQSRKLECLALSPMFDTILISDAEGISKPDPQIFTVHWSDSTPIPLKLSLWVTTLK